MHAASLHHRWIAVTSGRKACMCFRAKHATCACTTGLDCTSDSNSSGKQGGIPYDAQQHVQQHDTAFMVGAYVSTIHSIFDPLWILHCERKMKSAAASSGVGRLAGLTVATLTKFGIKIHP